MTGYLLKLANGIISWQSRAQKIIALSATEAEYMALSDCSRQVVWIQNIFTELVSRSVQATGGGGSGGVGGGGIW